MFFEGIPPFSAAAAEENGVSHRTGTQQIWDDSWAFRKIYIVKRDGKRAPFSVEKIKRAISKAFLSVGGYATDDDLTSVLSRVRVSDGMSVEEIQNQVEVALMAERYFAVAKSYMLYRQKHSEDREDREKLNS